MILGPRNKSDFPERRLGVKRLYLNAASKRIYIVGLAIIKNSRHYIKTGGPIEGLPLMSWNQITVPLLDVAKAIYFYGKPGLRLIVESLP